MLSWYQLSVQRLSSTITVRSTTLEWRAPKCAVLCSAHFKEVDFQQGLRYRKLKRGASPFISLDASSVTVSHAPFAESDPTPAEVTENKALQERLSVFARARILIDDAICTMETVEEIKPLAMQETQRRWKPGLLHYIRLLLTYTY